MLDNRLSEDFVYIALVYSVFVSRWNAWLYCSASLLPWTLINQARYINIDWQIYRMKNSIRIKLEDNVWPLYVIALISDFFLLVAIFVPFCWALIIILSHVEFQIYEMACQYQPSSFCLSFSPSTHLLNGENSIGISSLPFDYAIM